MLLLFIAGKKQARGSKYGSCPSISRNFLNSAPILSFSSQEYHETANNCVGDFSESRVYSKRQAADSNKQFLKIENKQIKTV